MNPMTGVGIFSIGIVFGYLLWYAVKHTKEFNIELLSTAIGAVGSGPLISLVGKDENLIGPYGLGLFVGFIVYFVVSMKLTSKTVDAKILETQPIDLKTIEAKIFDRRTMFRCKILLGRSMED
jgi:hypothetical protein